jgi:Plavaka transposase
MPWTRRQNRQLPLRFRDDVPQPPPSLSLAHLQQTAPIPSNSRPSEPPQSSSITARIGSHVRRIFRTPGNIFGLSRQYEATDLPSYDPEEHTSSQDLSNIHVSANASEFEGFYPYPNGTAFALGDWFWNGGAQKSQSSFNKLMDIIGDPQFQPADVQNVNWAQINKELGTDDDDKEWLDDDAGWTRTPVTISVPYQSRRGIPSEAGAGPQNFTIDDFYHRSLVSIIREKISGLTDGHQFHFEPYKLIWQRNPNVDPVQVQGELYTSPTFMSAHRELQDLPGEPGCDLPRVVAALMFWSDATQLTSFGNAKLWPLYAFFGNNSKYHQCKPSCHLCEHVAYFQTVSWLSMVCFEIANQLVIFGI